MTDDTPLERAHAEAQRRAFAARMARTPNAVKTPVHGRPTLEQEYAAQREAGLHKGDTPPAPPTRESTLNQDIADHLTDAIGRILSAP